MTGGTIFAWINRCDICYASHIKGDACLAVPRTLYAFRDNHY